MVFFSVVLHQSHFLCLIHHLRARTRDAKALKARGAPRSAKASYSLRQRSEAKNTKKRARYQQEKTRFLTNKCPLALEQKVQTALFQAVGVQWPFLGGEGAALPKARRVEEIALVV